MGYSKRILYVDDDVDGCEMMTAWLSDYHVTTAPDGAGAKEMMTRHHFDLYIFDYCLPDMTAVDLCKHIRSSSPDVPIIIYSALTRPVDKSSAESAGASDYLDKPNDLGRMYSVVAQHLGPQSTFYTAHPARRRPASIL